MDVDDVKCLHDMKGVKIVHINARSLYNKLDEISESFHFCDVIIITETWLNNSIPTSAINIDGFSVLRQDRHQEGTKKGGGICIYMKSEIVYDTVQECTVVDNDFEILGCKLKIRDIRPLYVIGVYRPPKGNPTKFIKHLSANLETLDLIRNELYIVGDVNLDYNSENIKKKYKLKQLESKFNFHQLINSHTRITNNTATTLDWIYTTTTHITSAGTLNYNISDHLPIYLIRKKKRNKIEKVRVQGRSYLRYDKDEFQRLPANSNWEVFDQVNDPNQLWQEIESNITRSLDRICPIRNLIVPKSKPDWLTNDLVQLMRKRDKTYQEARKRNDPVTWRKAQFLRSRVESLIKQHKKNKIQTELQQNRLNPNKFWNNIRTILPNDKGQEVFRLTDENTAECYEGESMASHVNSFFANIGTKLANDILQNNTTTEFTEFYAPINNDSDGVSNHPITEEEILDALKKIDTGKSSAIMNIRSNVIVDACISEIDRFVKLYNGSLTHCIFPMKWKYSTVIPLSKVTNPKTASDMRPISLLPLPGKILEHIISKRLKNYLDTNMILMVKQYGFRKKKSTLSAIVELLDKVYVNINSLMDTYIVYLDLKKAFDTVSHKLLKQKLQNIGLDLNTISWFDSYLTDRQQQTRMNNYCSEYLPVTYGVPQGSVLGSTLFVIYINEIAVNVNCDMILYADDTVLFSHDPVLLQNELSKVYDWCNENLLTINCKKSQWMRTNIIKKTEPDIDFKLKNVSLERVKEYKYLGLLIDSGLSFVPHRDNLISRVNLKIVFFRKIRKFVTTEAAALIYKATILPILEYADFFFDYNIQYINDKFQTIQNQALYTVYGQHYLPYDMKESTERIHRRCNLFRLKHRRNFHMLAFIFSFKDDVSYIDQRNIRTRQRDGVLFKIQHINHYKARHNPFQRAAGAWNDLPVHVRNATTKGSLKNLYMSTIINPYKK